MSNAALGISAIDVINKLKRVELSSSYRGADDTQRTRDLVKLIAGQP